MLRIDRRLALHGALTWLAAVRLQPVAAETVAATNLAQTRKLAAEEIMVPSSDPGIELYVRNKRPADMHSFRAERTVLFVHGATYPSEIAFDLKLDGISWMEYIAARGYDVYLLDLRGYGRSTRPKEMAEPPEANPPIVRGATALQDISAAVDFIRRRRNIPRLDLIGWSWGATLMAAYTADHGDRVERLVLYAPIWTEQVSESALALMPGPGRIDAYRTITRAQARELWYVGVPEDQKAALIPAGWFEAWADATWATDPEGAKYDPPVIRAPNGVIADFTEFRPYYDPAKITVPTLLVSAQWDREAPPAMAQTLFRLLTNAPGKRYAELAAGTHMIVLEKNRLRLFEAVQAFLDEQR